MTRRWKAHLAASGLAVGVGLALFFLYPSSSRDQFQVVTPTQPYFVSNQEALSSPPDRAPSSEKAPFQLSEPRLAKASIPRFKGKARALSQNDFIVLNGNRVRWVRSVHAVKDPQQDGKAEPNFPEGYRLVHTPPPQARFGDYDPRTLLVVADSRGIHKRVVTGAIVVKLATTDDLDTIAAKHQLDVGYFAPQIRMAILQSRVGQNVMDNAQALQREPNVQTATVEILGEGVRPQ